MSSITSITTGDLIIAVALEGDRLTKIEVTATNGHGIQEWPTLDRETLASVRQIAQSASTNGATPAPATREPKLTGKAPKKVATTTAEPKAATEPKERTYRKLAGQEDKVITAYQKAGSISALAIELNIPRHTAQSWVDGLRKKGLIPAKATA